MKELLVELAGLLGIPGELHEYETWDNWKFYGEITSRAPLPELEKIVPRLRKQYGDALLLRLKTADESIVFRLDREHPEPSFDDLRELDPNTPLTADLKIWKTPLAVKEQWADETVVTQWFLFYEALARELAVPLETLDKTLFEDVPPGRKIIILVPAHNIDLDSGWLAVIGGEHLKRWRERIELRDEPSMLDVARDHVNWVPFGLTRVTPLHLLPKIGYAADGDAVAGALHAQLFLCSALYLAMQSTKSGDHWTCKFSSNRQEAEVEIGAPALRSQDEWTAARTLGELARWTYEKRNDTDDRLIVVQQIVVDVLQNNTAAVNRGELLRLAGEVSKRIRWGWESFIGGELKKYLSQMKDLEEAVEKTTKEYSDQVSALTKTAIDNVLAAVAVIVGSFLAAIFKSPFQEYAFRFGTTAYAIYFFFFPMLMGLTATLQRFWKSQASFKARRESFAQRLTTTPVNDIVKPAEETECWFYKWYFTTVFAYLGVLAVLFSAIIFVPPALKNRAESGALVVKSATANRPQKGLVLIRGANFDDDEEIIVTIDGSTFTNLTTPPTLKVLGSDVLTLQAGDLARTAKSVTVRQGDAKPQTVPLTP